MTTVTSEVVARLHVHVRPRTKPRAPACLGSLAKSGATDFRTGGRWIDGTVCTQVRKTHWVRGVGLRLSECDKLRDFSALAPGGPRLMPSTGHCRELGCPPHLGAIGADHNSPSPVILRPSNTQISWISQPKTTTARSIGFHTPYPPNSPFLSMASARMAAWLTVVLT